MINVLWTNSAAAGALIQSSLDSADSGYIDAAGLDRVAVQVLAENGAAFAGRFSLYGTNLIDAFYDEHMHQLTPSAAAGGTLSGNWVEIADAGSPFRVSAIAFYDHLPRTIRVKWEKTSGSDSGTPSLWTLVYGFGK